MDFFKSQFGCQISCQVLISCDVSIKTLWYLIVWSLNDNFYTKKKRMKIILVLNRDWATLWTSIGEKFSRIFRWKKMIDKCINLLPLFASHVAGERERDRGREKLRLFCPDEFSADAKRYCTKNFNSLKFDYLLKTIGPQSFLILRKPYKRYRIINRASNWCCILQKNRKMHLWIKIFSRFQFNFVT